jgi:hypothetical protein
MTASAADSERPSRSTLRQLARSLFADPDHAPERFVLFAVTRLGAPAFDFAKHEREANADASPAQLSARVHSRAVGITRIDGAISGTPFLVALVPAYIAMLWEQTRMALTIAALHGRDTRDPAVAAELLWLRGAQPDLRSAQSALDAVARGSRAKPAGKGRARLGAWYALGKRFLVMAGFIDAPDPDAGKPTLLRQAGSFVMLGVVWMITWVFPVTFMLLMGYSGVNSTNTLAGRARSHYGAGPEAAGTRPPPAPPVPRWRRLLRAILLAVSVGLPLAGLAWAAHSRPAGVHWYYVLAALAGLSLALALTAIAARR